MSDPPDVQREYQKRLLADAGGRAAYNELFLREVLGELFGEVEREPKDLPVAGKPDFAVTINGKRSVVEAATLVEQVGEGEHRQREIVERLKTIVGPWVMTPDWRSEGLLEARLGVIERMVREYLVKAPRERHSVDLDLGSGRHFRFQLTPGHRADNPVGIFNFRMRGNPGVGQVQREVKDKSSKYAELKDAGIPFVVAFFAESPLVDEESLFDALYGQQVINVWIDEEQQVQRVEAGGLAEGGKLMPRGVGPPHHTTVSAVWFVQELPWADNEPLVRVVELPNPWAKNPIQWEDQRVARVLVKKSDGRIDFFPPETQEAFRLK